MFVYQHQRAQNDPNGNPQRLWRVWSVASDHADTVGIIDEGYGNFPRHLYPDAMELSSVKISRKDYHDTLRWAATVGILEYHGG